MTEAAVMLQLAERLSEAERTIDALLSGEIDAVVDPASRSPVLLFKAQHALRESEERYHRERDRAQRYLDSAEVVLLALDLDGNVSLVNRYACGLLGWSASELIGSNWIELCIPPSHRESMKEIFQSVLAGRVTFLENPVLTKAGAERALEWRSRLLTDEHGNVTGVFSCGTDISERVGATAALLAAEERMRFALETVKAGIWDVDFASGGVKWSPTLERLYGLEPGTFGGAVDSFIALIHPEDRAAMQATIATARSNGSEFDFAHRTLWADGTVRWLNGAGKIILDAHGAAVRGIGITLDVTEQHTLGLQYQQSQKMEAIGQLASGVAHDFNNLLTVILGFADLMISDTSASSEHGSDLGEIIKAAQRASGLTKQLLAFSRQQVLNPSRVDVNVLISTMIGMLERLIGENIEIELLLSPTLPAAVVDNGQLEQVVMNLMVNARDAMPNGGVITIRTDAVARGGESLVLLSITDTGEGMSEETERRLFEPFFTTKAAGQGTGLGLSTTYGIIKQSKGFIEVETQLAHGTTFKVFLPSTEETTAPKVIETNGTHGSVVPTETILLVEDEDGVRQLAQRVLDKAGYRVLQAANGKDAEESFALHGKTIDLVISDMIMPVCGGPELIRRLRTKNPNLRVLFMTGYSEHSVEEQAARVSGSPFVSKPFTPAELLGRVREELSRS